MDIMRDSPIPLYMQIKDFIRQKIEAGDFPSNTRLPSERQLADQFDVSRLTVTKAFKELEQEKLVYTQVGKGTYVTPSAKIQQQLEVLSSFTEDMSTKQKKAKSRILRQEVVNIENRAVIDALNLEAGDEVFILERLRLADGQLIALEKAHIPYCVCPNIESNYNFEHESLYHILKTVYHIQLTTANQIVEARIATLREAKLLEINKKDAVLGFIRTAFNHKNEPVEYVESTYSGDRYTLQFVLKPSGATLSLPDG